MATDSLHAQIIIIGAGPAGYTAAVYAARANRSPYLITGLQPGGQLTMTTDVENYPGFADIIQGPWLMEQMRQQAEKVGTTLIDDVIVSVDLAQRPFQITGDSGRLYHADCLIIATGAKARWLGLPSEEKFMGSGVSACATCDGFFYRGKEVAVIGGGNTAVEEALYLTNHAARVHLVHRRDQLRAEKILQQRLLAHPQIKVIWNSVVEDILGQDHPSGVTGVRLRHTQSGDFQELAVQGVFVAIGHDPATDLFKGQLDMDDGGYIRTIPDRTQTSIPGVYAAGDVQDKVFRQAVTAAGMGCMSALEAEKFLSENPHSQP